MSIPPQRIQTQNVLNKKKEKIKRRKQIKISKGQKKA